MTNLEITKNDVYETGLKYDYVKEKLENQKDLKDLYNQVLSVGEDKKKIEDLSGVKKYLESLIGKTWTEIKREGATWSFAIQLFLKSQGFYQDGKIDGLYLNSGKSESKTRQAVREFQKANGLVVDGWAGTETINKMVEILDKLGIQPEKNKNKFQAELMHIFTKDKTPNDAELSKRERFREGKGEISDGAYNYLIKDGILIRHNQEEAKEFFGVNGNWHKYDGSLEIDSNKNSVTKPENQPKPKNEENIGENVETNFDKLLVNSGILDKYNKLSEFEKVSFQNGNYKIETTQYSYKVLDKKLIRTSKAPLLLVEEILLENGKWIKKENIKKSKTSESGKSEKTEKSEGEKKEDQEKLKSVFTLETLKIENIEFTKLLDNIYIKEDFNPKMLSPIYFLLNGVLCRRSQYRMETKTKDGKIESVKKISFEIFDKTKKTFDKKVIDDSIKPFVDKEVNKILKFGKSYNIVYNEVVEKNMDMPWKNWDEIKKEPKENMLSEKLKNGKTLKKELGAYDYEQFKSWLNTNQGKEFKNGNYKNLENYIFSLTFEKLNK